MTTTPPASIGVPVSEDTINSKLGSNSTSLKKSIMNLMDMKNWADAYTAEDIAAMSGMSTDEANLLKSALGEVPQFYSLLGTLQFLDRTWGP